MGQMGPTRAASSLLATHPHVGIIPHGEAKEVGIPPSHLYRSAPIALKKAQFHSFFSPTLNGVPIWELRTGREVSL